jgi:hypothetical protein
VHVSTFFHGRLGDREDRLDGCSLWSNLVFVA